MPYISDEHVSAEDLPDLPGIEIKKHAVIVHLTDEQRADLESMPSFEELMERAAEEQRKFAALPVEEQRRILSEEQARRDAEKAARTCEHCGCDPDEHGGY